VPANALTGPCYTEQFSSPDPEFGYSYNGLGRIDYKINNKKPAFPFHYFSGRQPGKLRLALALSRRRPNSSSTTRSPIHVSNYSLILNTVLTSKLSERNAGGVNYFRQTFSDANNGFKVSNIRLLCRQGLIR